VGEWVSGWVGEWVGGWLVGWGHIEYIVPSEEYSCQVVASPLSVLARCCLLEAAYYATDVTLGPLLIVQLCSARAIISFFHYKYHIR
jgi:hypothetical protein